MKNWLVFLFCDVPFFVVDWLIEVVGGALDNCSWGVTPPRNQALVTLKHNWKNLQGIKAIDSNLLTEGGYMYNLVWYTDGSCLYHRR